MDEARSAFRERRFSHAARLFAKIAATSPPTEAVAAHSNAAAALLELGRFADASQAARAALELDGTALKAHYRLARALYAMGNNEEARSACERALSLSPDNAQLKELYAEASCGLEDAAGPSSPLPLTDPDYDERCEEEADAALAKGEYGQAIAWYSHAIKAAEATSRAGDRHSEGSTGMISSKGAHGLKLASLLGRRASALLALGRYTASAKDSQRSAELDPSLVEPQITGAAAMMHLGRMRLAEEMAKGAELAAMDATRRRVKELNALSVNELLRRLHEAIAAAALKCGGKSGRGSSFRSAANGLQTDHGSLEKAELAVLVEKVERESGNVDGPGESRDWLGIARRACAEVAALKERISEVEAMLVAKSFREVSEHASWLMRDYPYHLQLRQLRIEGLLALGETEEALQLVSQLLEAAPEAKDLLYAEARLLFITQGVDAARRACAEISGSVLTPTVAGQHEHTRSAELCCYLEALGAQRAAAQAQLDAGRPDAAIETICGALAMAEESPPTTLPLLVMLASSLARMRRLVEAVAVCDHGLAICGRPALASRDSAGSRHGERERLLLRRAGCFLELNQCSRALADYRSAARISGSAQAAAGVQRAWEALQAQAGQEAGGEDLYATLGVSRHASDEELRRAFHGLALKLHPDKTASLAEHTRLEASARFALARDAYERLRIPELRSAYDSTLSK